MLKLQGKLLSYLWNIHGQVLNFFGITNGRTTDCNYMSFF